MRFKTIIILLVVLTSHVLLAQPAIDSSKIVRVLSFNILHGATTKGDFNLDVIASVIRNANPDIVALQEVDYKTNRAHKYDLVTELAYRTNLVPLFGKAMDYDDGEYGEGILSKYTFIRTRNVDLPYTPGNEPRVALEVTTVLASGDTIAFAGTHLDHLKDEKDRIAQVKKINEVFSLNNYPTILAGDLNAVPGSEPINILEEIWSSSYRSDELKYTYPSSNPTKKIDYVMFYPKNRWKVIETQVIQDSIASDHCAYLVVLELLEE